MAAVVTLKKTGKLGAGLKYAVGTLAMASGYPTGGEVIVPLSDLGLNEVYGALINAGPAMGVLLGYDIANKKVMAYGAQGPSLVPIIFAGIQGAVTAEGTKYIGPVDNAENANEDVAFIVPVAGTISTLRATLGTACGAAGESTKKIDLTVRKNGADQTLVVSLAADAVAAADTTHSFTVAAGDKITTKSVAAAGIAGADLNISMLFTPTISATVEVANATDLSAIIAAPFFFWGW